MNTRPSPSTANYFMNVPVQSPSSSTHGEGGYTEDHFLVEQSVAEFQALLAKNPGKIVVKFGADWCGPCKKIAGQVLQAFNHIATTRDDILCLIIDVDTSFELYGVLRAKRQVTAIPAILCYHTGNTGIIPNDITIGANPVEIQQFFQRVLA